MQLFPVYHFGPYVSCIFVHPGSRLGAIVRWNVERVYCYAIVYLLFIMLLEEA